MKPAILYAFIASAFLGLSACNKAESPANVHADVAQARSDAVADNAKADAKVEQVEASAVKERADADAMVAEKNVTALVDAAVTEAEGDTKIALAKCEALAGDAQINCKNQANAHLDAVRAKAKAANTG